MANDHIPETHKAVWIIKIIQLSLAVLILAFSAYCVHYAAVSGSDLALFTSLFTIGIVAYYLIALHATPQSYNWVALLVLECLAVIFWLCTFSLLAAWYAALVFAANHDVIYYYKRDLGAITKRETVEQVAEAYNGLLITSLTFSVIEFILYCITLAFMGIAIHRHRVAGLPMVAGGVGGGNNVQSYESEMVNVKKEPNQTVAHQNAPEQQQQQQQQSYYTPSATQPSHTPEAQNVQPYQQPPAQQGQYPTHETGAQATYQPYPNPYPAAHEISG